MKQRMQFSTIEGNIIFEESSMHNNAVMFKKIIKKQTETDESPIFYVALTNGFDIVKRAQISTGHGGRDK